MIKALKEHITGLESSKWNLTNEKRARRRKKDREKEKGGRGGRGREKEEVETVEKKKSNRRGGRHAPITRLDFAR